MAQQMISGQALWGALSVITGFITDKVGIPVLRGERASTDSRAIYLPKLPDNLLSWSEVMKVVAWIYHESAHILKSDFSIEFTSPLQKAAAGILEDIRIELFAIRTFPAARRYLGELVRLYTEAGMAGQRPCFRPLTTEDSEAEVLQWYMLYRLREAILQQKEIGPVLETAKEVAAKKFPRGMMVRLDALMFQVEKCESEREVVELADAIIAMIKEEKQKEEDREQQSKSGAGGSEPPKDGTSGAGNGPQSVLQQKQGEAPTPSTGTEGQGSGDMGKLLSMKESEVTGSVGDMLVQEIGKVVDEKGRLAGAVSMPNQHPLQLKAQGADLAKLRASINAVRTRTLNWMSSVAESDISHARAGLIIDPSQLYLARMGGPIFVEEAEGIDLNAAVSIVIDRSGSMSSTIGAAAMASVATMLAFDVPGIKTQVTVFPVYGRVGADSRDEGVAVVKRWEETPRQLAGRIASLTAGGGTPMAEAVMFAAADLLRREETLRLVIVVTDGDPNDEVATREVIAKARANGITVAGLGIGVDPSRVFGERHGATLNHIGELSGAMVKLIKASMTRN